jgi:diaminohydroxyphosphoribosylaminopyrimidine deaminase/5-amino-6-(5-phosphoribosylamino)uracil reductase
MDAIVVGRATAALDDPLLTARPPGARTPARIVLDSLASLSSTSQLVRTARDVPVIVAAGEQSSPTERKRLASAGCEVLVCAGATHDARLAWLLDELGRRQLTNVLVEGGAQVLGSLFALGAIDEVHVFIAPRILGGAAATAPVAGPGIERMAEALALDEPLIGRSGSDVYVRGRVRRT